MRVQRRRRLCVWKLIMAVEMQMEDFPYLPSGPAEINKMIKEHGDLFSDSQCNVCSAVLISESQKLTHYQSKKHANKVRRYLSIQNEKEPASKKLKTLQSDSDCNNGDTDRLKVCHVCNMTFSAPVVAESHYQGKVHAKNLRLKTVGPQTPVAPQTAPAAQPKKVPAEDSSGAPATDDNNNPDRFCSICQASFNNPLMAQQHYVGKKHRKQMTKLKLMETYGPSTAPASTLNGYPCTICNIELNSVDQYQSHISGAKHKNQVKKSGLTTAENKHPAEQSSYASDSQFTAADVKFVPETKQFGAGDKPFDAGDGQYAAGEDTQYSELYQYT
ncbi:zinc finger protein 346 isoform X2 [Mugil cephalus]|uniref:zinc finger protein 346 isoform X2 n=1 Tax=Mugil cephalus TaxID=48193 RepID=UPI001FB71AE7|nr:zinc finger protein 346 isoform X2 [Mugil cephalus]